MYMNYIEYRADTILFDISFERLRSPASQYCVILPLDKLFQVYIYTTSCV